MKAQYCHDIHVHVCKLLTANDRLIYFRESLINTNAHKVVADDQGVKSRSLKAGIPLGVNMSNCTSLSPRQLVREQKVLPYVFHQGAFKFFHHFEHSFEVVKLQDKQRI